MPQVSAVGDWSLDSEFGLIFETPTLSRNDIMIFQSPTVETCGIAHTSSFLDTSVFFFTLFSLHLYWVLIKKKKTQNYETMRLLQVCTGVLGLLGLRGLLRLTNRYKLAVTPVARGTSCWDRPLSPTYQTPHTTYHPNTQHRTTSLGFQQVTWAAG